MSPIAGEDHDAGHDLASTDSSPACTTGSCNRHPTHRTAAVRAPAAVARRDSGDVGGVARRSTRPHRGRHRRRRHLGASGPAIRFAVILFVAVGLTWAAERLRPLVPTTAGVIAHVGAFLPAPVGIAGASMLGATWPLCLLIGGALAIATTELAGRRWQRSTLHAGQVGAIALAATGFAALTGTTAGLVGAVVAVGLMLSSAIDVRPGSRSWPCCPRCCGSSPTPGSVLAPSSAPASSVAGSAGPARWSACSPRSCWPSPPAATAPMS